MKKKIAVSALAALILALTLNLKTASAQLFAPQAYKQSFYAWLWQEYLEDKEPGSISPYDMLDYLAKDKSYTTDLKSFPIGYYVGRVIYANLKLAAVKNAAYMAESTADGWKAAIFEVSLDDNDNIVPGKDVMKYQSSSSNSAASITVDGVKYYAKEIKIELTQENLEKMPDIIRAVYKEKTGWLKGSKEEQMALISEAFSEDRRKMFMLWSTANITYYSYFLKQE